MRSKRKSNAKFHTGRKLQVLLFHQATTYNTKLVQKSAICVGGSKQKLDSLGISRKKIAKNGKTKPTKMQKKVSKYCKMLTIKGIKCS